MVTKPSILKEGIIVDTQDIQDLIEHDEGELEDEDINDEAQKMVRSWDRESIMKEINEEKDKLDMDEDGDFSIYYDGEQSFDELKKDMEPLEGNLVYVKVLESRPSGKEIFASHTIMFDRIGFFEYNPMPWESSIHDGKPSVMNLASESIISGLLQGLLTLRQGERANILIHPAMAFGALGSPPLIPRNAYIYYNVKIHKVWEESDFDGMLQYERSLHILLPLQDKVDLAKNHKDVANQYLSDDQPREALIKYKAAIKWLEETPDEEREQSLECRELMNTLWQNIAITQNRLGMHKSASKSAKKSLCIDPRNVKAFYQLAKARIALGDHARALDVLDRAQKVVSNNASLNHLRSKIDAQLRDEKTKRSEIMRKMAKACCV